VLVLGGDLLEELNVIEASRDDQERSVRTWLAGNEPNQVLARSLFEDGFAAENVSNKRLG